MPQNNSSLTNPPWRGLALPIPTQNPPRVALCRAPLCGPRSWCGSTEVGAAGRLPYNLATDSGTRGSLNGHERRSSPFPDLRLPDVHSYYRRRGATFTIAEAPGGAIHDTVGLAEGDGRKLHIEFTTMRDGKYVPVTGWIRGFGKGYQSQLENIQICVQEGWKTH